MPLPIASRPGVVVFKLYKSTIARLWFPISINDTFCIGFRWHGETEYHQVLGPSASFQTPGLYSALSITVLLILIIMATFHHTSKTSPRTCTGGGVPLTFSNGRGEENGPDRGPI